MEKTLVNFRPKMCWLRLNTGEYVCIPALGKRQVDAARLEGSASFAKLRMRGVLGEVPAPAMPSTEPDVMPAGADAATDEGGMTAEEESPTVSETDEEEPGKAGDAPGKKSRGAKKPPRA